MLVPKNMKFRRRKKSHSKGKSLRLLALPIAVCFLTGFGGNRGCAFGPKVLGTTGAESSAIDNSDSTPLGTTGTSTTGGEGLSFDVKKITLGYYHSCRIKDDGTLRCWGDNAHGQLGNGTALDSRNPGEFGTEATYRAVAAGDRFSCAITPAGALFCSGMNYLGQLGDGSGTERLSPVPVDSETVYSSVGAGVDHGCAITQTGALKCWGLNDHGQLGDGSTTDRLSPVAVVSASTYRSVSGGSHHTCALTQGGGHPLLGEKFCGDGGRWNDH